MKHMIANWIVILSTLLALAVPTSTVHAATNYVNECTESALKNALWWTDEVRFQCDGTITLTSKITITGSMTIDANGHNVTISGNNQVQIFFMQGIWAIGGSTLTLKGLKLENGYADKGGAIFVNSNNTVILQNVIFSNNHSYSGGGGAIYADYFESDPGEGLPPIQTGVNLSVSGSEFNHNGTSSFGGGAILLNKFSTLTVGYSTFFGNDGHNFGGAIYTESTNTLNISNSWFSYNRAGSGGAIENVASGPINLTNVHFDGNTVASSGSGGAINNYHGTLTVADSFFRNNGVHSEGTNKSSGTGIDNSGGIVTVSNSDFSDNSGNGINNNEGFFIDTNRGCLGTCPGILTVTDSYFFNNGDSAIRNDKGTVNLTNSTFAGNRALISDGGVAWAGGVNNTGILTVTNCTFLENQAEYYGGGIVNRGTATITKSTFKANNAIDGGAIFNTGTIDATQNTFTNNIARGDGGGIYNEVDFDRPGIIFGQYYGTITLANDTFSGNSSSSYGGGIYNHDAGVINATNTTFWGNNAVVAGGGIFNVSNATITNSILWANTANQSPIYAQIGPDYTSVTYSDIQSAEIFPGIGNINIDPMLGPLAQNGGATFTHALGAGSPAIDAADDVACAATPVNNLDQRGVPRPQGLHCDIGAFEYQSIAYAKPTATGLGDCTSWNNACSLQTALAVASQQVWVAAGTHRPSMDGDWADTFQLKKGVPVYGGFAGYETSLEQRNWKTNVTILNGAGTAIIVVTSADGATLDGLTITAGGNGIYNDDNGTLIVKNCTIYSNSAAYGGGIFNYKGTINISNSIISGNSSYITGAGGGGGIYNLQGTINLSNSTISGNSTPTRGGGIHNSNGTVNVANSTFSENRAGWDSGGIYSENGTLTIKNSTFSGNSTSGWGGGVYVNYSTASVTSSTFSDNEAADGSGIFNIGDVTLGNTIIANSRRGSNCGGWTAITASGRNLSSDATCPAEIRGDPFLGPLQDNGGPTLTYELLPGSPAIDMAVGCLETDQRGVSRPQGAHCDIGAFEAEKGFTLTITSEHGMVTKNPGQAIYHDGDVVTLSVTPEPGWTFTGWTPSLTNNQVTITGDMIITANYLPDDEYVLTITSYAELGTVTKNPDKPTYHYGDMVELTVTPDPGVYFAGWGGDLAGMENPVSITIHGNTHVEVMYALPENHDYVLTINSDHGIVTKNPDQATYHYGDVVTLSVTPEPGWTFTGWTPSLANDQVTITGDTTVTANYTQDNYTLTINSDHGTVTKSPDQSTYHYGDAVTLSVTPEPGWIFTGWTPSLTDNQVTITGDTIVTANYTQNEYDLAITTEHGVVTKNPDQATYHYGDVVELTAIPDTGWSFANWSGAITSSDNPASVTISGDTAVNANYKQQTSLTLTPQVVNRYLNEAADFTATLTDSDGQPLGDKDILFLVKHNDDIVYSETITTDGSGQAMVNVPPQPIGQYTLEAYFGQSPLDDLVEDADFVESSATATLNVIYNFDGFLPPVADLPATNQATGGSAIPIKFTLGGAEGLEIFVAGYPASQLVDCSTGLSLGPAEEIENPGSTLLSYDVNTGRYTFIWKTDKAWRGTCRMLILKFDDGTEYKTLFKFK